eukprot:1257447-Pyramimonas_sp.AAC.1
MGSGGPLDLVGAGGRGGLPGSPRGTLGQGHPGPGTRISLFQSVSERSRSVSERSEKAEAPDSERRGARRA